MTESDSVWNAQRTDDRICSVTTGLVKNNWDKDHPGMVRAEYFLGTQGKNVTGWIPVAAPYAFKECGMYLLPEIGSEVLIAFQMGDRNCPVVIGCLWNQVNVLPADTAAENNTVKRLRTRGGCEVIFREEQGKETIEIRTPADLNIRLEDENQIIALEDAEKKNGMLLEAKDGNIKVFSEKKLVLEVGGKAMMTLDGEANAATIKADKITQEAANACQIKGQNLKLEGTQTEIAGKSKLSVQSGGMAQIKGATVKIN